MPNDPGAELSHVLSVIQARQEQTTKQQGLGRPIISTVFQGYRIVAVGTRLYYSKNWRTFHDFLLAYIETVFGRKWFEFEQSKRQESRHALLKWRDTVLDYLHDQERKETAGTYSAPFTGAVATYLGLSYNLYLIAHNARLQERLLSRLKDSSQFLGANYETYVAAAFIKAGFVIHLEDESRSDTSHCEFNAEYPRTGRLFSVEAKARGAGKPHFNVSNQLYEALKKQAKGARVVFIEMNVPDPRDGPKNVEFMRDALEIIRRRQGKMTVDGRPAPPAYVILTNHPYHYALKNDDFRVSIFAGGFGITDFGLDARFRNIREARLSRERHFEIFMLVDSMRDHFEIPATFEGEIPEFGFSSTDLPRLLIGQRYLVPSEDGTEVPGELIDAVMSAPERSVWGVYRLDSGKTVICTSPVTDDEVRAYVRHPDTFFGAYRRQAGKIETPLDAFDFLYRTYRHSIRDKLLDFLKDHPDYQEFKVKSQEELAVIVCEYWAELMFARTNT